MRDILFRGKRLDNGEWVEGDYFRKYIYDRYDNGSLHHLIGWQVTDNDGEKFNDYEDVDPDTVGQYTGLQDKNGKEIWEGDIVMAETNDEDHPMSELPFVIVFSDGAFCIAEDEESPWAPIDTFMDMEVIGNIHDNPDLLK